MSVIELDRRIGYRPGRDDRPAVDDEHLAHEGWQPRRKLDSFHQGRPPARAWLEFALTIIVMLTAVAVIAGIRTWTAVGML